ncbi:uncharacterized protein Z519_06183 [Cladophialophora bantiana CBS 173.52]|uniref:Uncharacterized protein n=1 Tax=Cladophialophora bantiana (strain ATCC 10958 / CBS 173.52 / CDC B-1940 / NIH 8579) TaxID=1442370 RepID=A0A0D2HJZ1_CLAB1|nr:uncharacterized protein Z519_06183 [Cladophialophora bantiana CBS 173.52]KIW93578.1 hypothetical protein Z519_06183 [Cladophialophora bantiana CBS 173.52]
MASGLLLSRVTSAPEPGRSVADGPFLPSLHQTPQKRDSPMDHSYRRRVGDRSPPPARHLWSPGSTSPRRELEEPPDKRPRLEYIPEKLEAAEASSKRKMYPQTSSYVYPGEHRPPNLPPEDISQQRSWRGSCGNCSDTESLVMDLVRGFLELQSEVSRALAISTGPKSPFESIGLEVTKLGLKQSLTWTINELRNTSRLIQSHAATAKPGLPPLADVVPPPFVHDIRRLSIQGQSSAVPTSINDLRKASLPPDTPRSDDYHRRLPEHPPVQMPRPFEQGLPPVLQGEELKRNPPYEQAASGSGLSPHPSSSSSVFGSVQSPMQSQPSTRTLPSPPGNQYPRTGSSEYIQYSPTTTQAAHNAHLQDLQHQISTKTLALQTLQREHDQLLAAFSRSQIRCTALDKKSQVSDHEINTLSEDKIRLQQQVEALEIQVQELVKSRDEAHQQSSADGAQWRQIVAMSSQLQLKGADEARRFKLEREAWERERSSLQKRIEELESGKEKLPETRPVSGSTTPVANDPILTSGSVEVLREEIIRLRRRCVELELMLQELAGEAEQIESAITAMENVRKSLASKKRRTDDS